MEQAESWMLLYVSPKCETYFYPENEMYLRQYLEEL